MKLKSQTFELDLDGYLNSIEFCSFNQDLLLITLKNDSFMVFDVSSHTFVEIHRFHPNVSLNTIHLSSQQPFLLTTSPNYDKLNAFKYSGQFKLLKSMDLLKHQAENNLICIGLDLIDNVGSKFCLRFDQKTTSNCDLIVLYGTNTSILFIDFATNELIKHIDLKSIRSNSLKKTIMPQVINFHANNHGVFAALLSVFQNEVHIVRCAEMLEESILDANIESEHFQCSTLDSLHHLLSVFPQ